MSADSSVSVIVATRNRHGLLQQALAGITSQTHTAMELLVVDDGSGADTLAAYDDIGRATGGRVQWILREHPGALGTGPAATRNRGIRAAGGAFVAFCDDDDRWIRADHLSTAVRALEQTGADFYFCNLVASRDGQPTDYVWFPDAGRLSGGRSVDGFPDVYAVDLPAVLDVVASRVIHPDCWVVRRSLLEAAGGFWERVWFSEDYELMMRLLDRASGILFRSTPCVDYRLPAGDAHSLRSSELDTLLQEVMAMQHLRLTCRSRVVRRHARAREAWGLRQLARSLRRDGRAAEGRSFAWQGLCTFPTLGAVRQCLFE
ncbi:MAG: glycosyltransferase family 2 protein [Acidobacteria bacterium]|nr:glycosyltransferase family 2 protein [Acidobacteriota bacterium]